MTAQQRDQATAQRETRTGGDAYAHSDRSGLFVAWAFAFFFLVLTVCNNKGEEILGIRFAGCDGPDFLSTSSLLFFTSCDKILFDLAGDRVCDIRPGRRISDSFPVDRSTVSRNTLKSDKSVGSLSQTPRDPARHSHALTITSRHK